MDNIENINNKKEKNIKKQKNIGFSSELISILKKIIVVQFLVNFIFIILIFTLSMYYNYHWSQYDTVVVDSQDGGNANYIGNDGDVVNNGENSSKETEKIK